MKMLRCAEFYSLNCILGKVCSCRTKFNEVVNAVAAENGHYIMNVTTCSGPEDYDICHNLSPVGAKHFWRELDHLMERFDRNEIQLLPANPRGKMNKRQKKYPDNFNY